MMKLLFVAILLLGSWWARAEDSPLTISADLTLLPASLVSGEDRLATLGDRAVVSKEAARNYASPQGMSQEPLLVVEDRAGGRLGTTQGGILVRLHSLQSLDGLAADYGLTVGHVFTAQPMGILVPEARETADTHVANLEADDRVISAELNVNFYQEQAQ